MKDYTLKYILFFLLLFAGSPFAQAVKFQNLTMADGLSHSRVNCIGQDKNGFIWVGTHKGLNIYDGIRFKHLFSDRLNEQKLPGNRILNFAFDGDSVWIATSYGLCKMDIKTKQCKRYDLGDCKYLISLCLDKSDDILWVGTSNGLVKLNIRSGNYKVFDTSNSNITHNEINTIFKDSDNNLWVGTFDQLNLLRSGTDVFESINLKMRQYSVIEYNLILSISPYSESSDSLLWVGTEAGLVLLNRRSGDMQLMHEENTNLSNSVIKTIFNTKSGATWFGTDFGLNKMDKDHTISNYYRNLYEEYSLTDNVIRCVFEDNSGVIWFGTNNGMSMLSSSGNSFDFFPVSYLHKNNKVGYEINDIIESSDGNFWLASQNGALKVGPNKKVLELLNASQKGDRKLADDNTTCILEDFRGNIWIASNGGLAVWNVREEKLNRYSADNSSGLRSNYIASFILLKDSTILVNTEKGLHKVIEKENGLQFEFLKVFNWFTQLSGDYLWSFSESRLFRMNVSSFEQQMEKRFEIAGRQVVISSLLVVDENNIWMGIKNGLIHYNPQSKQYEYYLIDAELNYTPISIQQDDSGNIWATSFSAILKFSKNTNNFDIFPCGDKIPLSHFKEHCSYKSSNGNLLFGGQDGFIQFAPDRITKSDFIPPVFFTQLLVTNLEVLPNEPINRDVILKNDIAYTRDISLSYVNNSFSVEFSSLQFTDRHEIRYAHKLENFDTDWIYTDGSYGIARYSNLKPGKYILKIKGSNNDGVWNEEETMLTINIESPLWASTLALIAYFIILIVIVGSIILYYKNWIRVRNQLDLVQIEKDHTEELSDIRQRFFTNIAHEFRTPLSLIIGPTEKLEKQEELCEKSKNYVKIIENNARRLLWLNNQLLDFRKLDSKKMSFTVSEFNIVEFAMQIFELFEDKAKSQRITYQFHSDLNSLNVLMDIRKIETILFNLLSNAFKFTPENGTINLKIEREDLIRNNQSDDGISFSVSDSGIGIAEEEKSKIFDRFYQVPDAKKMEYGSGIGLTMVKEYVTMHQGEIKIESEVGKGSEFKIVLPLLTEEECKQFFVHESELLRPLLKPQIKVRANEKVVIIDSKAPFILLVEDDLEMSDFITLSLGDKYRMQTVRNGKEALRMVNDTVPDLVVSDINMPEMDGIELTKRFKDNPKTAHIPLILLTGESQNILELEGLKNGADAFMLKPFKIEMLELRIDNLLKRQEQVSQFINVQHIAAPKELKLASQDEKLLKEVVASIEKFISDPDLHVDKVCDDIGYGHSMLYRKIKKLTGQTLNEFIRTTRVKRAEQLLRTKKFNISEVMLETGFTNHYYFSKSFKRVYNLSPKEYVNKL